MRDGFVIRVVKRVAHGVNALELRLRRRWLARSGHPRYRLTGTCNGCGRCCDALAIQVERFTWNSRVLRAAFLWYQRRINGFELVATDPRFKLFRFRCTHYDAVKKQCDSYETRPHFCRDYPLNVTYDAAPELFPECSYGVVDKHASALVEAMQAAGVAPEKLEAVRKKLYLGDD